MQRKNNVLLFLFIGSALLCAFVLFLRREERGRTFSDKPRIVCTTSIIADAVKTLIADDAVVHALMGPGIDPHLYKPRPSDGEQLSDASLIFYNGLHLEGKMVDIFVGMENIGKKVYGVGNELPESLLRKGQYAGIYDPHIWFDVSLWHQVVQNIARHLIDNFPTLQSSIEARLKKYEEELLQLDDWVKKQLQRIPQEQRILISAHDAFGYFCARYQVRGEALQGLSTDGEVSGEDMARVATLLLTCPVSIIFVEQTVGERYVRGVKEIVKKKGKDIRIGKKLFSDALGEEGSGAETYSAMVRTNVTHMIEGWLDE